MGCTQAKPAQIHRYRTPVAEQVKSAKQAYDDSIMHTLGPAITLDDDQQTQGNELDPTASAGCKEAFARADRKESALQYAERDQTIIIFDWDDTLFPTSWARAAQLFDANSIAPDRCEDCLSDLAFDVGELLCQARILGQVVLVTNASRRWVDLSCEAFMPDLKPILDEIPVFYAKELMTDAEKAMYTRSDGNTEAKRRAMHDAVSRFYSRYEGQSWKNVVSIGDMHYERDAMRQVVNSAPSSSMASKRCRKKSIKLLQQPSLKSLRGQLSLVARWLPRIVRVDKDVDLDFGEITKAAQPAPAKTTKPRNEAAAKRLAAVVPTESG